MKQTLVNTWLPMIGLLVGIVIVMFMAMSPEPSSSAIVSINEDDHSYGNSAGQVTLIEYSDFQCPACASIEPILKTLREQYPDKLNFVYRHFPLKSIHRNAEISAQAAEAAGKQGKFWEMHNMIFEKQSAWSRNGNKDTFIGYAQELSLDIEKFKSDLNSSEVSAKVDRDLKSGEGAGVQGTPTFFLNGEKIQFRTLEEFVKIIEQAINEKYSYMDTYSTYHA